jgi:prefoldin subunit 5
MPLTPRQAILSTLAGTALLNAPLQAKEEPKDAPKTVSQADFDALKKQLDNAPKASEVAALKSKIEELEKTLATLKASQTALRELLEGTDKVGDEGLLKAIKKLDGSTMALETRLKELDKKLETVRTANASPATGAAAPNTTATLAGKGTVRIVNEYPVPISMLVNGTPHRLEANTSKDVSVDTGNFKYQLLNSGLNEVTSPVKENETVTLRVK